MLLRTGRGKLDKKGKTNSRSEDHLAIRQHFTVEDSSLGKEDKAGGKRES